MRVGIGYEAEGAFFLLSVVQPQDCVEAVEQPPYVGHVLRLRLLDEVVCRPAQPADLMFDLGMGTAEPTGRLDPAECPCNVGSRAP